ncbi:NAD(P)/FAD-dependent oxidoreductase [Paracnuella aquatica]|uniref:NAD(P)/FAD-dependent oxidoreductase n=1 Tax=Paracnuella aquatica TaxID=2268757 RepID=UPI000DEF5F35|nr:FAD-dependent oxidoreductase [Paracnuella aquatica]RPD46701.1 FAD-binding oxidoreductase [Paracnuella aquatica]
MISIWEQETFFAPQDIIIAGSGFNGLWAAFYLKKKSPKLRITILEGGAIPTGASTRNAGFACFGSLSELVYDGAAMGTEKMQQLVELRYKGVQRIRKHFKPSQIDFDLCGGYELFGPAHNPTADKLDADIAYINTLLQDITGSKSTFKRTDKKLENFGFGHTTHLVKNKLEGYLHSGKLLQCLLQTVQSMGVQVLNGFAIKSYEHKGHSLDVHTENSYSFTTAQLLVCTNAFAKTLMPDADIVPARGQVLLTSPIDGLQWKGAFHSDEGYYYFRNLGNRVLLGGARNKDLAGEQSFVFATTDTIQDELERYLAEVVLSQHAGQYSIERRWSGIMAMGSEKTPIVGEVQPRVFASVRMSGMGVALAPVVAQQVADMLLA